MPDASGQLDDGQHPAHNLDSDTLAFLPTLHPNPTPDSFPTALNPSSAHSPPHSMSAAAPRGFPSSELQTALSEVGWGLTAWEVLPAAFCAPNEARAKLELLEAGDTALVAVSVAGWKVCLRSVVDYGVRVCLSARTKDGADPGSRGCRRTARRRTTRRSRRSTTCSRTSRLRSRTGG